jgi:IS605 OrfB family transposase
VSLLTLTGRILVPFIMGRYQAERFTAAKGQCDLVRRKDGKWFLLVTVDLPDGTKPPTTDFLGVDLGVENLAADSDGQRYSGAHVEACRMRHHTLRRSLQKAAAGRKRRGLRPKNIRRKLKFLAGCEARFRKDVNHVIAKTLVAKAKDTGRGVALEDLQGIRNRTRFRKQQRAKMGGWAFHQLRTFIEYKARQAGVELIVVDPGNTSRQCPVCGHIAKANRPSQSEFRCVACGHTGHADVNAARNIRSRARAAVNQPIVSEQHLEFQAA